MRIKLLTAATLLSLLSCTKNSPAHDDMVRACIDSFAVHYFNFEFSRAIPFVTPDSEKWLQLAASNVTQDDLDLLYQQEERAEIDTENMEMTINDSVATAWVNVTNFLDMTAIGESGKISKEATFCLSLVRLDDKWKIKMEGLPRSEKRNRDAGSDGI